MKKFFAAVKAFFIVLSGKELIAETKEPQLLEMPEADEQFKNGAAYALHLLQREGRLIDFLQEDITPYSDEQVGAAVRQIHRGCKKIIDNNFPLQLIVDAGEGSKYQLPADFDRTAIKLSGNVPDELPADGVLQHKGWQLREVKLPELSASFNCKIIAPAEVSFE